MKIKTDLSKFNNDWYNPGNKLKIIIWFFANSIVVNNYLPIPMSFKVFILKLFGAKIGKNLTIKPKVNIKYPWFLEIGNNVWIGETVWIDNFVQVTVEDDVCISQGATLLTGNHNYKKSNFEMIVSEIYLEKGSWIGAKSVVCGGVRCSSHSVLAVNSVATKNLNPYMIYQGNPAEAIRERIISE